MVVFRDIIIVTFSFVVLRQSTPTPILFSSLARKLLVGYVRVVYRVRIYRRVEVFISILPP